MENKVNKRASSSSSAADLPEPPASGPLVMKFGGASLGTPQALAASARQTAGQIGKWPGVVVVVSAFRGVTNNLLETADLAASSPELSRLGIEDFRDRHTVMLDAFGLWEQLKGTLQRNTNELKDLCASQERLGCISPGLLDQAASLGERTSAPIFAAVLRRLGVPAVPVDARKCIFTDAAFQHAAVLMEQTQKAVVRELQPTLRAGLVPVVTGFIGSTLSGQTTTLGRGGSDTTAALLADALNAKELWNWADLDGVMTSIACNFPVARSLPSFNYI
ncbi:MAG: hypothetical protein HGA86_06115 [Anaerolineaceae bacterium]|nr:hypothetical protein [Anaerolineaceae bacterium]